MKKKLIYLTLLAISIASCDSAIDELTTKDGIKSEEKKVAVDTTNITILGTTKIFPKLVNKSETSKMSAYVYLTSTYGSGSDRIIVDSPANEGNKLVLRMQTDGNLCFNVVKLNTENSQQPTELKFIWGTFNYAHQIGNWQLINDSNGNVAIFKDYGTFPAQVTYTTNTVVSPPDFESQYLEITTYRKNTVLNIAEKRTFAKIQLIRKYPGGNYQAVKTLCDEIIAY